MPIAKFQLEDGRVARFEVPEGTTPEQAQSLISEHMASQPLEAQAQAPKQEDASNPIINAIYGFAARGNEMKTALNPFANQADMDRVAAEKEWVKQHGGSGVGSMAADVIAGVPAALAAGPVAGTALGAGLLGGAQNFLTTPGDYNDRSQAGLTGLAGGALAQHAGNVIGSKLDDAVIQKESIAKLVNALNAPKKAALEAGQKEGYVLPPSEVNPTWLNRRLESIAGKAATEQEAALRNQTVTTDLARRAIGIEAGTPLSEGALKQASEKAYPAYQEISDLPTPNKLSSGYSGVESAPIKTESAKNELQQLKQARADAQGWYRTAERTASPDDLAKAKTAENIAKQLDQKIGEKAQAAGRDDLMQALYDSRKRLAKIHNVDDALNVTTGEVSGPILSRMYDKGAPFTDELKTIGDFAQAFPKYVKEGEKNQHPGVSKIEASLAAIMGGLGGAAMGPVGLSAAAIPLLSGPVRSAILSKPYQKMSAKIVEQEGPTTAKVLAAAIRSRAVKSATPAISSRLLQEALTNE